jgi:hypothetical protein
MYHRLIISALALAKALGLILWQITEPNSSSSSKHKALDSRAVVAKMHSGFYTNALARQKRELTRWPEASGSHSIALGHSSLLGTSARPPQFGLLSIIATAILQRIF